MSSARETGTPAGEQRPTRKWPRRVLATALAVLASGVGLELTVRHLAFGDSALARRLAPRFRQAWRYAPPDTDDHWLIRRRLTSPGGIRTAARPDALLGWTTEKVAPGTYRNVREDDVGGRRPVLLYGDSFAACATPPEDCFEGLLEASEAGGSLALLNFGGNGYGFDQTYLLLRETVERFAARRPVVVVSLLVDDDLNRMLLSYRSWPKPRFERREGEFVLAPAALENGAGPDGRRPSIRSYAWRRLLFGSGFLPPTLRRELQGAEERDDTKRVLTRELLTRAKALLEGLELDYAVLLFHGTGALASETFGWEEAFLEETLDQLEMPWLSSRVFLGEDARAAGRRLEEYFDPALDNHLNRLGNEVVLRGLLAELLTSATGEPGEIGERGR